MLLLLLLLLLLLVTMRIPRVLAVRRSFNGKIQAAEFVESWTKHATKTATSSWTLDIIFKKLNK